ncbi:hypothetical protein RB595_004258 [Gaeumannomyces hyphopodioides]
MSSPAITKVAVAGGTGGLGSFIVKELVAAGFEVTVLRRAGSTSTPPEGVAAKDVDYASLDSLTAALQGQHAVVSAVATAAAAGQKLLADAALAAGVRRFIPSEFGINTRLTQGHPIGKILAGKVAVVDHLAALAAENPEFSWTGICTGFFWDSVGPRLWTFRLQRRSQDGPCHIDSGNEPFQASTRPFIGRAVAAVLRRADETTANKYLLVASFQPTQNEILSALETLTGAKWTVAARADTAELQAEGERKLAAGDYSAFPHLLERWCYGDGVGHRVAPADDAGELLGLPKEDLSEVLRAWLGSVGAI